MPPATASLPYAVGPSFAAAGAARPQPSVDLQALLRRGNAGDALTPGQRRAAVGAIVAAHLVGIWALLQVDAVREVVRESAPMFVDWIAPPTPPAPQPVVTPMPVAPAPKPPTVRPRPAAPIVTAAPRPNAPTSYVVPAPSPAPPEPAPVGVAAPAPEPIVAPPAPAPAPIAPKVIPPSAVQYLVEPAPEYPRLSARAGESGRVLVLVHIDQGGLPSRVQVATSSGHPRLDAAAVAAVQKARFRPPTLDGQPISGWANVPIDFGLEK